VEAAANLVQAAAHPDANIIFGATFDDTMDDEIRVTVIATGFDETPVKKVEKKEAAAEPAQGLFTQAAAKAEAAAPEAEAAKEPEEDPFDSIFKIFNSK